ncbi:MAG: glycosyltransferase family 2 protein [Candidatus Marinimicrobia bacterium]|nr:glycosyltransferase family 2 protein [Candidatus Neomarinimicrobiota bacterium]
MPSELSVTVIVLNWNGSELLKDCLNSLEKVEYDHFNILVVDNGSTDDSVEYVTSTFLNVDILELDNNLGFAAGNNAGFKYTLLKNNPDIVVFLNNDTIVDPKFLDELINKFENPSIGMSTAKIFYADEPNRIWFNGADVNLAIGRISHRNIRELDSANTITYETTDYATGCCLAIKSDLFSEMDGFDEKFPMYAEDVDLSIRVNQSGREIAMASKAHIWHKVSSSMGGEFSLKKMKRKLGGLFRIYNKHATLVQWMLVILFSPYLVLTYFIKYFRLRFFTR